MKLPQATQDFVQNGAPEGQRNNATFFAAQQFRDAGISESAAMIELVQPAVASGISESEAMTAIRSAYQGAKRDPIGYGHATIPRGSYRRKEEESTIKVDPLTEVAPQKLPSPINNGIVAFLSTCFRADEMVSVGWAREIEEGEGKGRIVPDSGITQTPAQWIEWINKFRGGIKGAFHGSHGVYVRVNPMQEHGDSDHQVSAYRHCLVEFDKVSKEEQYGAILASKLPVSAIIDSAGKSVHAWVRVDARNRQEFDARVAIVFKVFENCGLDAQNRNPSRYSRLPDAWRGDVQQKLLQVNVGATSWDDWEVEHEQDGLPDIISIEKFMETEILEPHVLIEGVLHKGCKMVLGGPSKARKTWVMMDLALSVANGLAWMGHLKCNVGRVLYMNFELIEYGFQNRAAWLIECKDGSEIKNLDIWNLRGHSADIALLVDKIIRRVKRMNYDLIIVDPIYKSLGNRDENKAGDMTELLNHLDRMAMATGSSIAFAAHFPKGNMGGRESMDRIAGSGVFARDPDAVLTMTEHEDNNEENVRFVIEANLRNFPELKKFVVAWSAPLMIKDTVAPKVKGKAGRRSESSVGDITQHLPATAEELVNKVGKSKRTVARRVEEAKEQGLIEFKDGQYYVCKSQQ